MLHKPESSRWSALLETLLIFPESVSKLRCIPKLLGCKMFSHQAVMNDQKECMPLRLLLLLFTAKKDEHINVDVL